jgi:hypothetical protein
MKPLVTYPSFWLSPESTKGYQFESWVVEQFPENHFLLKEWRSDKHIGARFADAGKHPDLIFQCKGSKPNTFFAIECKYRTCITDNSPDLVKPYQFKNYRDFEDSYKIQVFVAIGQGGYPHHPETVSLIPLAQVNSKTNLKKAIKNFTTSDLTGSLRSLINNNRLQAIRNVKDEVAIFPVSLRKAK